MPGGAVEDFTSQELTAHYRDTSEITQKLWEQRNRTFLFLILAIGVGATMLYKLPPPPEGGRPIIFEAVVRLTALDTEHAGLVAIFPYPVLHAIVLIAVFYLMVVFFHRSATVLRNFSYLSLLEKEIRAQLKLAPSSVAFTREGDFYWNNRPSMFGLVKYMYVGILGCLLVMFFLYRGFEDISYWRTSDYGLSDGLLVGIDILVAIPTFVIFVGYVRNTLNLERRLEATKGKPPEDVSPSSAMAVTPPPSQ